MLPHRTALASLALLVLFVVPAFFATSFIAHRSQAREYLRADLKISAIWARASVAKAAESFLRIENTGTEPDKLLSMSSPAAKTVELQRYEGEGGYKGPQPIDSLEIPAGQSVTLAPGGTVLALVGLKRPLDEGTTVSITLTFERAGAVSVSVPVLEPGTQEAPKPDDAKKTAR